MNIANRIVHDVHQGTGPWLRLREGFFTASEAPAALGHSLYTTRAELLRRKYTGVAEDHSPATLGKFAAGHAAEALARPMAEEIAQGDLYPVTVSADVDGLKLLASLDGLTLDDEIAWETKLWNDGLAEQVRTGTLDPHYTIQMDQELLVSGARRCLFTCTDGTPERFVSCWYETDPAKFDSLIAGLHQFERDLETFQMPTPPPAAPVGRSPNTLPALHIQVSGKVTASNLAEFKGTALAAIRAVNRDLNTDADFADAEKAVKWCGDVESRLAAAKEHALSQTADIDAMFKAIDDISAEARRVRIDLGKLVDRRKTEVKQSAIAEARRELDNHIADLNAEIAPMRVFDEGADFAGAIRGLRSFDAMRAKIEGVLIAGIIAADASARTIRANAAAFKEIATGFEFLFADLSVLVHKTPDDFKTLAQARVDVHRAAVAAKAAEAERLAREKLAAQQAEAERKAQADRDAADAQAKALRDEADRKAVEARNAAQALLDQQAADQADRRRELDAQAARQLAAVEVMAQVDADITDAQRAANSAPWAAPVLPPSPSPSHVAPAGPPTLKLDVMAERLGFHLTSVFLDKLRFQPVAIEGTEALYHESSWFGICNSLIEHVKDARDGCR